MFVTTARGWWDQARTNARPAARHGRPPENLVPIEGPPYYCVPLVPGGPNTSGGPKRNARAEILNPYGEAIPGLYGAGELGQPVGQLYPAGGCNLSEGICFGQIAVESALETARAANGAVGRAAVPSGG